MTVLSERSPILKIVGLTLIYMGYFDLFCLVLFEQVGYSIFLVQYRKVFSDQYNFFERVDLTFV